VFHARAAIEDWRFDYNQRRPHTTPDGMTPVEFIKVHHSQNSLSELAAVAVAFAVAKVARGVFNYSEGRFNLSASTWLVSTPATVGVISASLAFLPTVGPTAAVAVCRVS